MWGESRKIYEFAQLDMPLSESNGFFSVTIHASQLGCWMDLVCIEYMMRNLCLRGQVVGTRILSYAWCLGAPRHMTHMSGCLGGASLPRRPRKKNKSKKKNQRIPCCLCLSLDGDGLMLSGGDKPTRVFFFLWSRMGEWMALAPPRLMRHGAIGARGRESRG